MKENETKLIIDIDKDLHQKIKLLVVGKNQTIKDFVLIAIGLAMQREKELGNTE